MQVENDIYLYLKKYWGYDEFRPLQKDIILSVLNKKDTLALLPTGGGKSICFQIPGLVIGGTCLVISPLIALMNDQVANLKNKGLSAVAITSAMTAKEIDITLDNAALGHVQFLYVSPERIENETFRERLSYLPIGLIAVDEAHCISQWGYDFRPSYLKIAEVREYFPKTTIIAVTASATKEVVEDIQKKLLFTNQSVFKQSFERKNLRYVVQFEENKFDRLLKVIKNISGSGVIYVRNRKKTKEISEWLISQAISASFYHAGLTPNERALAQEKWINNNTQVIVATNAFGMGIDKPNVRFVVHLDLPESIEAYFQEAGRAGRDLKPAYSVVLINKQDVVNLKQQFEEKTPTIDEIKQSYQALFNFYQIPVESGEGLSINFNSDEICRNYNLKAIKLYNSIKCLEKEGYLSLIDSSYEPSKVMFLMPREELYHFQIKFSKYESLIKVLLRSYGGLYEQYAFIKEKDVAYRAKISEIELTKQLENLHQNGVISFIAQNSLPKLIFLRNRVNIKFSGIELIQYPILKQKGLDKIESVINYVTETKICRNRMLLSYFNETDFTDCGFCDVCVERNKKHVIDNDALLEKIKQALMHHYLSLEELLEKVNEVNHQATITFINQLIDDDIIKIDNQHKLYLTKN